MTIYDVAKLTEDEAWERVQATRNRHAVLQRIYDHGTLAELIRRRQSITNHLLFWLVLPADDGRSVGFWSSVADDLKSIALEKLGAPCPAHVALRTGCAAGLKEHVMVAFS